MRDSNPRAGELQRELRITATIFSVILLALYASTLHLQNGYLTDLRGVVIGADFVNSWTMGKLSREQAAPELNYAIPTYMDYLHCTFGEQYPTQQWSYPPSYALMLLPFGLLPYTVAWILSVLFCLGFFIATLRLLLQEKYKATALTILCAPASCAAFLSGQLSLAFTSAQLLIFHWLDRRPYLAGMLLGLLSVKPQIGLIYPIYLIATRRWKTIAAAVVTTLALIGFSAAVVGQKMWESYLTLGISLQHDYVLQHPPELIRLLMPTLTMDLKTIGISHARVLTLQAALGLAISTIFFTQKFRRLELPAQQLTVAAACVLATPYLMPYDLIFLAASAVLYAQCQPITRLGIAALLSAFWLPILHLLAAACHIPGTSLLPLLVIWWARCTGMRKTPQ